MSFSVVIDSTEAYSSTSIYNQDYAIDWSFLDDGEYDLTFSFVSSPVGEVASDVKCISLEGLGTQLKVYLAGTTTDTKNSNVIGLLNRVNFNDGTARQRFQQSTYNPPVVLKSRPSNNIFKVKILQSAGGIAVSGMGGSYILILHFNKRK